VGVALVATADIAPAGPVTHSRILLGKPGKVRNDAGLAGFRDIRLETKCDDMFDHPAYSFCRLGYCSAPPVPGGQEPPQASATTRLTQVPRPSKIGKDDYLLTSS
jgi:hypothetical protein